MECRNEYVLLGSCFAQNVGERMIAEGMTVCVNPLGTLYNPHSILHVVRAALNPSEGDIPVFHSDDEWRCWWANTTFKTPTPEGTRQLVLQRLQMMGEAIRKAHMLVVTLGTNVCYKLRENGLVVTNCQRQPDRIFEEYRSALPEVKDALTEMVELVKVANPAVRIVYTVSPYRYRKYGLHGSQLSKATLLLAVDEVVRQYPESCTYFPSYEIMMDELRDYSYYAPDGLHPSPEAVKIIWQRFNSQFILRNS